MTVTLPHALRNRLLRRLASRWRTLVLVLLVAIVVAGCTVGPAHVRPSMPISDRFVHGEHVDPAQPGSELAFWQRFDDPLLAALIEDALAANHDLRIGLARWQQAQALLRHARQEQAPSLSVDADMQSLRSSRAQATGARDQDHFEIGIGAIWELDFFGRLRRQVEADHAQAQAAQADLAALQVAVVADLASSYFELRGLQARLRVARDHAGNQGESLRLVQARLDAGQGTAFDTARAEEQLASTRARSSALNAAIDAHMHRIAVLAGRAPDALIDLLEISADLPVVDVAIDPGTPGDLLRRRPDVAAAERRLAAATARVGIATADLFPRFTLGALFASQASSGSALFRGDSESRLLGLGASWAFLDLGRVRARIDAADAAASGQLAHYERTVLRALEETETALTRYRHARVERELLREAANASTRAIEQARLQFDGGLIEFLAVLDAERSQLDAEDRLALSESEAAVRLIEVYRALAGGWPGHRPDAAASVTDLSFR